MGRIVNVTSGAGTHGVPGARRTRPKGGIVGLSLTLALELERFRDQGERAVARRSPTC
jgi:NAD(P)-dependent dehydrogenase (short-subunit alcohol dehydrogenase family)